MAASDKTNKIILTGVMMAITAVATMVIAVPVPFTNGYIHLGDSMVFIAVLVLGYRYGAIAAGTGSAMADMLLGYVHWAPWTFIIKGIMALLMGFVIEKTIKSRKNSVIFVGITLVIWAVFNYAVGRIIEYEAVHNPVELLSDEIPDVSALGEFLSSVQSKLMLAALLIPLFLIIIAAVLKKKDNYSIPLSEILGMTLAGLFMVFGYYIAGGILYGNFAVSAFSIPMNMIQFIVGFLVASLINAALSKTPAAKLFTYRLGNKS
jgi:uncharacterized membrane protein